MATAPDDVSDGLEEYQKEIRRCPIYTGEAFGGETCTPEDAFREVRIYHEEQDRYYTEECGGCRFITAGVKQWRKDLLEFHELVHGSGTIEEELFSAEGNDTV